MKIYSLVVIYNKKCEDSLSIQAIQKYGTSTQLVVFDNSNQDFNNDKYCKEQGFLYFSTGKNIGLSKAYNYAIDHIPFEAEDYLITLDDDTELTQTYFDELIELCGQQKYDVILPIIISGNMILSPSNLVDGCRSKTISAVSELKQSDITAINSGAIIRMGLFNRVKYNERLFLDYVDHDFMKKAHKADAVFKVMDSKIDQHYSRHEMMSLDKALKRFDVETADLKTFCQEAGKVGFYRAYMIKLVGQLTLKYKTPLFIRKMVLGK